MDSTKHSVSCGILYHSCMRHSEHTQKLSGTDRLEIFSDGVFAITITLLVLEIQVPHLTDGTVASVLEGVRSIAPSLLSFAFSFLAICVFWVNHYYFFRQLTHTDWPLLWHNAHLLFWMALVPFTTAFLAEYSLVPAVISIYSFVMFMGALSFNMLIKHAFFHGPLTDKAITMDDKKRGVSRGKLGIYLYAASGVLAFVSVWISWSLLLFIPLYYVVPRLLVQDEELSKD